MRLKINSLLLIKKQHSLSLACSYAHCKTNPQGGVLINLLPVC